MEDAQSLRAQGSAAFAAGDFVRADQHYSLAIEMMITRSGAEAAPAGLEVLHCNRAAARLRLKQYAAALHDASAARQLHPTWSKPAFRQAMALKALGDLPAALQAAAEALQLEPSNQQVRRLVQELRSAAAHPTPSALDRPRVDASLFPALLRGAPWSYAASPDGVNENLLILLHGLGDTPAQFMALGRTMALPQTAVLALGGPQEVAFTQGGRSWFTVFDGDMELIAGVPGERRRLQSLELTVAALQALLTRLRDACGWQGRQVHVLGFSQGGTAALALAQRCAAQGAPLRSFVAISAALLEESIAEGGGAPGSAAPGPRCTSVLITHGTADRVLQRRTVESSTALLRQQSMEVSVLSVPGKGHAMVQSPEEAAALFKFWSKHLSARPVAGGADEGATLVEIAPGQATLATEPP